MGGFKTPWKLAPLFVTTPKTLLHPTLYKPINWGSPPDLLSLPDFKASQNALNIVRLVPPWSERSHNDSCSLTLSFPVPSTLRTLDLEGMSIGDKSINFVCYQRIKPISTLLTIPWDTTVASKVDRGWTSRISSQPRNKWSQTYPYISYLKPS